MSSKVPISVLIPARNEADNLLRCLEALSDWADEIIIVDSHSTDRTAAIAELYDASLLQFDYKGGWPKKRQATLDTFPFRNAWILLLDADEILLDPVKTEIKAAIRTNRFDGYWLKFEPCFLGRQLRYGDTLLWKLSLFRNGKGHYEKRLESQDNSMGDIEIHEHVVVDGIVGRLKNAVRHENVNSYDRYIQKHNEYSNWEVKVFLEGSNGEFRPSLWGLQAQRRRWLKRKLLRFPGSPLLLFLYKYLLWMGFLDGIPGLYYCAFQAIHVFNIKSKLYAAEHPTVVCRFENEGANAALATEISLADRLKDGTSWRHPNGNMVPKH